MIATHKVSLYGIRCWFNDETFEIMGVNRICDWLVFLVVALHQFFCWLTPGGPGDEGFPMKILEVLGEHKEVGE